jgi:5'-nucleotidase
VTHILLTNDDGYESPGLAALRGALEPLGRVSALAPAVNRSGVARGITTHDPLHVDEVTLADGTPGWATDGTPVDCVRIAALGLLGDPPDLIVSGIDMGPNLGDDVTYSGTVAAALEGVLLGLPAMAVSQDALGAVDSDDHRAYDFRAAARVAAGLARCMIDGSVPVGTLLNVNAPGIPSEEIRVVRVTRLGRRVYRSRLSEEWSRGGRTRLTIVQDHDHHRDEGTDFLALERGEISVTPLHFDLTHAEQLEALERLPLEALLAGL